MIGSYDYRLVALSVVIAMFASYAALDLAGRVTAARGWMRSAWLAGGAAAMGCGIWSMHYIGMLAFHLPIPVEYDWRIVLLSLLAAILASAVALYSGEPGKNRCERVSDRQHHHGLRHCRDALHRNGRNAFVRHMRNRHACGDSARSYCCGGIFCSFAAMFRDMELDPRWLPTVFTPKRSGRFSVEWNWHPCFGT